MALAHIYKITNIKNNKIYVGFTINEIEVRLRNHIRASRQNKSRHTYLHSAIRKYGEIYFVIEELEFGEDKKLLKEREKFWIEKLNPDYNLTKGGEGCLGYKHSKDAKFKITGCPKGAKQNLSEEQKNNLSIRMKMMNEERGKGYKLDISEEDRKRRRENMIRLNKERKGKDTTKDRTRDDKGRFLSK
jgi:group I intron endonuclease